MKLAKEYDLVILGGGTGGYVAAIRASQLGLKTAIVEKTKLGGTCLHKGCIPSKALLRSAEVFSTTKRAAAFGVDIQQIALNFQNVQVRKNKIITQLHNGVKHLLKKGKIDIYEGVGRILGPSIFSPMAGTISVEMNSGKENEMLLPKNIIIATGSRPRTLPALEIDGEYILSSDEALELNELPDSIIIVGGGVIGIEWASMLADFEVDVTVIESAERILATEDRDLSKEMERLLRKKGIKLLTNANILPDTVQIENEKLTISVEVNNEKKALTTNKLLISIGRQANSENIGLQNTDIAIKDGFIEVNDVYQTKESHIYAIGDVIGGLQLAHVASYEGITAVEHIANQESDLIDYTTIPTCIYSNPEIASIGLTEQTAKEQGYNLKIGKFPFKAIGKALVFGEVDGFVKIIADKETDDILGIHMIGPHVTDMISEAGLAKVLDATPWEIAQTVHPHPTLSEAIGEAALAVDGKAIHSSSLF